MQKLKRTYNDKRGNSNLTNINSELQGVQRIMVQNIDDVMQRGVAISGKYLCLLKMVDKTVKLCDHMENANCPCDTIW